LRSVATSSRVIRWLCAPLTQALFELLANVLFIFGTHPNLSTFSTRQGFQPCPLHELDYSHVMAKSGQKFGINLACHGINRSLAIR
jgi:hypothetical protein